MRSSLSALLDRVPQARDALPHLSALENALRHKGDAALDEVPPRWRSRLCAQLSSLPTGEDDRPLRALRDRLMAGLPQPACATPTPPDGAAAPAAAVPGARSGPARTAVRAAASAPKVAVASRDAAAGAATPGGSKPAKAAQATNPPRPAAPRGEAPAGATEAVVVMEAGLSHSEFMRLAAAADAEAAAAFELDPAAPPAA
ncbi:MAG: hypothetical protein HYZ20_00065 [Burkholderiales bacterium]|nr:hypothetical protein [Burkholderiales bacterium]